MIAGCELGLSPAFSYITSSYKQFLDFKYYFKNDPEEDPVLNISQSNYSISIILDKVLPSSTTALFAGKNYLLCIGNSYLYRGTGQPEHTGHLYHFMVTLVDLSHGSQVSPHIDWSTCHMVI